MHRPDVVSRLYATAFAVAAGLCPLGFAPLGAQTQLAAREPLPALTITALRPVPEGGAPSDRVWRGTLAGRDSGTVTMVLERSGAPDDPNDPVWPVVTRWTIESNDPAKRFTAELFGKAQANGRMHLTGVITEGYQAGAEVQLDTRAGKHNHTVLQIFPQRAS